MPECSGSVVQQIQCALAPVVDKLGQGAEYGWESYYRQTLVEAGVRLLFSLIFLGLAIFGTIVCVRYTRRTVVSRQEATSGTYSSEESWGTFVSIVTGATALTFYTLALSWIYTAILRLLNPSYYTIQRVVDSILGNRVG